MFIGTNATKLPHLCKILSLSFFKRRLLKCVILLLVLMLILKVNIYWPYGTDEGTILKLQVNMVFIKLQVYKKFRNALK